uniref:ribosomal protein L21 n=1 Tax=Ochrosphaera neapolitana TaxID=35137 RepID=UPI00286AB463|nr:ribosomal protein L21 [Ochrosphaera neapolitana]WKK50111.1 ribosomal protein L21 [Ochrosphaera neapolitana]
MGLYAIVEACGKQFWVEEGRYYDFAKLPLNEGDKFILNNVLLVNSGGNVEIGQPFLDSSFKIEVEILRHIAGPKTRVYKMRPKKKTRRTFGAKPKYTRILVKSITKKTQAQAACFI